MMQRSDDTQRHSTLAPAMLLKRRRRPFGRRTLLTACCTIVLIVIVTHDTDRALQRTLLQRDTLGGRGSSTSLSRQAVTVNETLQRDNRSTNYTSGEGEEKKSKSQAGIGSPTATFEEATPATSHEPPTPLSEQNHHSTRAHHNEKEPQKIIMVTYVFGEDAINKRYLRLFVESARRSGIDRIAIVGPTRPGYLLPPNVKHVPVTWDDLVDRVRDRIFDGREPGTLRQTRNFYKVIDFKPLFAHLFPELVESFDWWGHVDNDMVLGNVRKFLNKVRLAKYDIIASFPDEYTSGPFMVYRNTPAINELFRFAERPLEEILATHETRVFDEWGGGTQSVRRRGRNATTTTDDENDHSYASTMAGIIDLHNERLGLRWFGGIPSVWDGFCRKQLEGMCTLCKLVVTSGGREQTLYEEYRYGNGTIKQQKVAFCHFEFSKETVETSLSNDSWKQHLDDIEWLCQGQYRMDFFRGLTLA